MKRLMAVTLMVGLAPIGFIGCAEKTTTTKQETKIVTPRGTKITIEREVKKTGEESPATTP